jgi:hypothetical protein
MGALRDQQAHRPIALELESERAAELQGSREQHRSHDRLPEKLGDRRRVVGMCAELAPGAFQMHPVSAYRLVLEDEATHLVARNRSNGG